MNESALLRIAGQIAGIGGIVVVILLLLYRQVLLTMKPPDNMPAEGYLKAINKIILFTFIVAIVGLVIYAVLSINENLRLAMDRAAAVQVELGSVKTENATIKSSFESLKTQAELLGKRFSAIEEASVKERSSSLEVRKQNVSFDLTAWKPVDQDRLAKEHVYQVWTRKHFQIAKAFKEARVFSTTFGTSSPFEPVFSCETHPLTDVRNSDLIPPGKPALRRWTLQIDISKEEPFKEFDIVEKTMIYNSFANPIRENCGTLITFPSRQASIEVVFPIGKTPKPDSLEFTFYTLGSGQSPSPFKDPDYRLEEDGKRLLWNIPDPRLAHHYQIEWRW